VEKIFKNLTGLLPFTVALAAIGIVIWWLLGRDMAAGKWLLAAFLLAHGLVHALFGIPPPASAGAADRTPEWPFDLSRSWLITSAGLDAGLVRLIGVALVGAVTIGFGMSALATVAIIVPYGWWPALVAGSAVISAVVLVGFFNSQLVLGLAIDAVLLWVVVASAWAPAATSLH
jgi:hypothetical protein